MQWVKGAWRWVNALCGTGRPIGLVRRGLWGILFAIALTLSLVFQACGGDTLTDNSPLTGDDSTTSLENRNPTEADSPPEKDALDDALDQEHSGDKPDATPIAMVEPAVPVTGEAVTYATVNGESVTGYLARPTNPDSETLPALITIHEWWGLNDNIEAMARRLAGEGYTVLAIDLYDNQIATDPNQARDFMRGVMDAPGPAQDNINQAADFLKTEYNAPALGSIGWCFGGNWSLRTGLLLTSELDAMAIYYGQLILAPEALDGLDMPIIGFFGEEDSSIPVQDVNNFEEILTNLGKDVDIHLYPDTGHAFANPSGQNYDEAAAEDAWEKTTAFFAEHLQS
ncbi:MAG: dienelactone hydrolase family protein [Cyanobacteria bacterium J06607_10]